ncbi:MAG: restriction endonuclease subunit S [Oscillospiraceae bacterium]|nr:restriction endonuclease subunit S [Oscillospiraceae bacterium]
MREMKDSGIEWIGEIPIEWNVTKMKYFVKISSGEIISKEEYTKNGEFPVIGSNGEIGKVNKYNNCESVITTGRVGTVGTIHIVEKSWITDNALIIKNQNIEQKYLSYVIVNFDFKDMLSGTAQPLITATKLKNQYISCPSYEEQQKISAYLDKKCAEIDSLIPDIQQQIEILEKYKRSIITKAVTKGLDPDVEMRDSEIEWIGNVPENWEHNTVLNCIDFEGGSQPALNYFIGEEKEGYIRLIQNRDYKTDAYKVFVPISMVSKFCDESDVMIGRYGPPLFVLHRGLKGAYNVALMKAIPKLLDREYMAYYLQNYTLIQYIESFSKRTAGQSGVNTDILKKYPIYVPPMYEQKQISDYLDKKCEEIDSIISEKKQQIKTIEEYKKSLIFEYVTGKKEVN